MLYFVVYFAVTFSVIKSVEWPVYLHQMAVLIRLASVFRCYCLTSRIITLRWHARCWRRVADTSIVRPNHISVSKSTWFVARCMFHNLVASEEYFLYVTLSALLPEDRPTA